MELELSWRPAKHPIRLEAAPPNHEYWRSDKEKRIMPNSMCFTFRFSHESAMNRNLLKFACLLLFGINSGFADQRPNVLFIMTDDKY
ncbi:MAG: hypothetical protein ACI9HK_001142 [Pirellulaceae bacterium]